MFVKSLAAGTAVAEWRTIVWWSAGDAQGAKLPLHATSAAQSCLSSSRPQNFQQSHYGNGSPWFTMVHQSRQVVHHGSPKSLDDR